MPHRPQREQSTSFMGTLQPLMIAVALAFAVSITPREARAQTERSGKQVVDAVCATCHAAGVNGRAEDRRQKAWAKRASQGLSGLTSTRSTASGRCRRMEGARISPTSKSPAQITYMVNQSGGRWVEPVSLKDLPRERSGEQIVQAQCRKCHDTGVGGAPKIGDRAAWAPRIKDGLDNTVRSAIRGHGGHACPRRHGQSHRFRGP